MRRFLPIFAGLFAILTAGCSLNVKVGPTATGDLRTEIRSVEQFHAVKVTLAANTTIEVGKPLSVTVTAQESVLPLVRTEINEGRLEISAERPYSSSRTVTIHIQTPSLDGFEHTGAGKTTITGVDGRSLSLALTGVGGLTVSGKVDDFTVNCSGVGSVDAFGLVSQNATVSTSGVGSANVNVVKALTASTSGVGNIVYEGRPAVTASASGVGKVRAR